MHSITPKQSTKEQPNKSYIFVIRSIQTSLDHAILRCSHTQALKTSRGLTNHEAHHANVQPQEHELNTVRLMCLQDAQLPLKHSRLYDDTLCLQNAELRLMQSRRNINVQTDCKDDQPQLTD